MYHMNRNCLIWVNIAPTWQAARTEGATQSLIGH